MFHSKSSDSSQDPTFASLGAGNPRPNSEPAGQGPETDPLAALVLRDSLREIFDALTATERLIAILRALTWTDEAIAEYLDIQPASVGRIIQRAQRRLVARLPLETAGLLRGRRQADQTRQQVHNPDASLSTYQAARILDVTPQRITHLCRVGGFPNAYRQDTRARAWVIPARDLDQHLPDQVQRPADGTDPSVSHP